MLTANRVEHLLLALQKQPPWSDFPLVVLARDGGEERQAAFRESMNVTLVERPIRIRSLISVLQAALRSRRHQYTVRDLLTASQAQSATLQEKEARLLFTLEAGRLGAWELELDTGALLCSDICKATYGRPPGSEFSYTDLKMAIHPDDRERVQKNLVTSVELLVDFDVEYRTVWPDETVHWVLTRGRVGHQSPGRSPRISGVSLDITHQKNAELSLREADRRKDEFLALLAHELRNPLAPLQNGIEVLQLASEDPTTVVQTCGIMARQLHHMVRLIDDLLDVARISQNKIQLRRQLILVNDVVQSAIETARPLITAAGHQLFVSLPEGPVYIDADFTRIAQVISNLLTNSSKYVSGQGRIFIRAEQSADDVVISVEDNGIGIPKDALGTIFEMFSQVDQTIERTRGGLGIGLALVRGLVEMHGGSVTAESAGVNRGSTFSVRLPAAKDIREDLTVPMNSALPRSPRRILVVDDNRDSATTLAMMLRLKGDEVRTAHDGLQAIEVASTFRPDVILMDVGMPRMNGHEATLRIREEPWGRKLRIIALTGWGQETDRAASKKAGCDGHLVKPVQPADLEQALAEVGSFVP